ncbi:ACL4 protein, partial [Polyodon spathula]|nr:ACL4 protein [Polyodon spathula]
QTEEYMDNFDFEMAQLFCQRALDLEPTNLNVLDMLGNICAELGNEEKAKQISFLFLRAVELSPDEGHSKYMYLGQIHSGVEAVQYFSKGVEAMLNALEKQTPAVTAAAISLDDPEVTNKDVSVAFCSIAEIFFTDLCMDDGAAEKCKEAIDKALQYDPDNPEALQLMASYLFSIEKTQVKKTKKQADNKHIVY